jgi:hypothetical protein
MGADVTSRRPSLARLLAVELELAMTARPFSGRFPCLVRQRACRRLRTRTRMAEAGSRTPSRETRATGNDVLPGLSARAASCRVIPAGWRALRHLTARDTGRTDAVLRPTPPLTLKNG